jgi:endonuclease/exonuclease/phosphatase (EEP) superfamily protein YafD
MIGITMQKQKRNKANHTKQTRLAGINSKYGFWLLTTAAFFMSIALMSTYLARWGWFFEMISHFRVHIVLGLLSIALLFLWGRQWPLASATGLIGLVGLASLLPFYLTSASVAAAQDEETIYRALAFNVYYHSDAYAELLALVEEVNPDIIVLSEVTEEWYEGVQSLASDYPYSRYVTINSHGRLLYSRLPFADEGPQRVKDRERPSVVATLDTGTKQFNVIGVHVKAPMSPKGAQQRNQQLADLSRFVQTQLQPSLLLGDFNITPWSPIFRDFLADGDLKDARVGHGLAHTWPTFLPVLGVPIDHAVTSAGITIHNFRRGPHIGSDHYPIIVDFSVK